MAQEKLYTACKKGEDSTVENYLFNVSPKFKVLNGETPLHASCYTDNPRLIKLLLIRGARINSRDLYGNTPLHIACDNGNFKAVKSLLKAGANSDARNHQGCAPIHLACGRGYVYIAKILLRNGADREINDKHGQTPLHIACKTFEEKNVIAIHLLRLGADFDAKDYLGNTPLHLTCKYKNPYLVSILLELGANINSLNKNKVIPIQNAFRNLPFPYDRIKCMRMVQTFQKYIIKMNELNKFIDSNNTSLINQYINVLLCEENIKYLNEIFKEQCFYEVGKLKETIIKNGVSLYDFLRADSNKISVWFKDEKFISRLKGLKFRVIFPAYSEHLKYNLEKGIQRKLLLDYSFVYFFNIFKDSCYGSLPLECVENILFNLSNRELCLLTNFSFKPKEYAFSI